ncbi:hypothetical protein BDV96DRAFT_643592 [Lophiotrema nucula]|uniref:DUF7730 domain-containing protein n=1 Tax=Lophiotrema nucula TaxID=690887 RepID=A0A6A5ZFS4_9PLEO|nr:hypothetical protein BDV96DRAFT_643592 [Lophiotrema nucula]
MEQLETRASASTSTSSNIKSRMSLIVKLKVRTVVKQANGMLDGRPRGIYVERYRKNAERSPLLHLPAEIRNIIFRIVLGGLYVGLHTGHSTPYVHFQTLRIDEMPECSHLESNTLALLCICRQIYADTALLPFASNCFWIWDNTTMKDWYEYNKVLRSQIGAVTMMQFWADDLTKDDVIQDLMLFPNLKQIHVQETGWSNKREVINENDVERRIKDVTGRSVEFIRST